MTFLPAPGPPARGQLTKGDHHHGKNVGGPHGRRDRSGRGRFQLLHPLRQPDVPRGHHGQHGARGDARRAAHPPAGGRRCHHRRAAGHSRRHRPRRADVRPRVRGHPHVCRAGAHRAHRRPRQEAAHRPLAQRSGRARPAHVPAQRNERHHCADKGRARGIGGAGQGAQGRHSARLHAPAARAAHHLRPPPDGLCHDAPARHRPHAGCRQAHERLAHRLLRPRRHDV